MLVDWDTVDLMRDTDRCFPTLKNPEEIKKLRAWHCKYRSLLPISEFVNLEELVIATFPDTSLDILSPLRKLTYLSILHRLEGLQGLENLESLSFSTLPSWDGSSKFTEVDSLEPLSRLRNLKHIELCGVIPKTRSLAPLELCKNLQSAWVGGRRYPKDEVERFYRATGVVRECNPPSSF